MTQVWICLVFSSQCQWVLYWWILRHIQVLAWGRRSVWRLQLWLTHGPHQIGNRFCPEWNRKIKPTTGHICYLDRVRKTAKRFSNQVFMFDNLNFFSPMACNKCENNNLISVENKFSFHIFQRWHRSHARQPLQHGHCAGPDRSKHKSNSASL
jgi:hypothetical protein